MKLFEDEKILYRFGAAEVVLTTHRLRQGGHSEFTSIMLEEVCSVSVARTTHLWLLLSGVVLLLAGAILLVNAAPFERGQYAILGGLLFLLIYWLTRKSFVEVASAGASIRFPAYGESTDAVLEFTTALESAKNQRYMIQTLKAAQSSTHVD